ncbi:hypothetical protein ACEPAF_9088 [Sanghuangporus sanghuang]
MIATNLPMYLVASYSIKPTQIARDTLSETGVSAHPFVACPAHLIHYREAYFNVLSAARSLVPYIEDPEVKLRLRRLLLPLTSTSCFRVMLPCELKRPRVDNAAPGSFCSDDADALAKREPFSHGPSEPAAPRRKTRRASASAALRFTSLSMSHSSRTSDSALRLFTGRSFASPRRLKANPYPRLVMPGNISQDDTASRDGREDTESTTRSPSSSSTSSVMPASEQISPELPISIEAPPSPKPIFPPIQYVSPQTPKVLGLLQQQRRYFSARYPAYRKNSEDLPTPPTPINCDWSVQSRTGLSGIDCNIPGYKSSELPSCHVEVFSKEEYDSADENFRKGLGWFPTSWRNQKLNETPPAPASPPELTWNAGCDDVKQTTYSSQMMMSMLGSYPDDPEQSTPLAESTCISTHVRLPMLLNRDDDQPAYNSRCSKRSETWIMYNDFAYLKLSVSRSVFAFHLRLLSSPCLV